MTSDSRPGWRIEDVLARTDLAALLDDLAEPAMFATRGRRWHCPLPAHEDNHASVTIHTDHRGHQRWRCWSGDNDHRGDAVDLVRITQHMPRSEAVDWLASRAGMTPDLPLPPVAYRERSTRTKVEVPLDPAVHRYVEACERILWGSTGRPVLEWLHGRGFGDELLRANRVGCDPGREMMQRQRGLPYGGSVGAVFPALNERGDAHYVQTRYIDPGRGPKYDNPAASLGHNPRLAWTRSIGTPQGDSLIVCEGIPDALTASALGHHAVGVLGSQSPDDSVAMTIGRRAGRSGLAIILINDHDAAGQAWASRLTTLLEGVGVASTTVQPPEPGMDLNGWFADPLRQSPPECSHETLVDTTVDRAS